MTTSTEVSECKKVKSSELIQGMGLGRDGRETDGSAYMVEYEDGSVSVYATNQSGFDSTTVDLKYILQWVRNNRPDLLKDEKKEG